MSGERTRALLARLAEVECPAFAARRATRGAPTPIVLAEGRGAELRDVDGRAYVDLAAGFGALLLGHGHPAVAAAVRAQSERLVQGLGDVYASDVKIELLEALARFVPDGQVLLAQSGSDAVTAALKTATLATGRHAFVAFDGAYHGLGYGPLPACGFSPRFAAPFGPQLSAHVRFAPYPGLRGAQADDSLNLVREHLVRGDVAAVLVEPVLGRGGIVVPPAGFVRELARLARAHGALCIADEIWTGLGRTGAWFAGEGADVLCLGKGLGGGLPISACIASRSIMEGWARAPGTVHTSTHAGAPLACAAALATLRALSDEGLVERARTLGERARASFREALDGIAVVRGVGLMIGVELESAATAQDAVADLREAGFVVVPGGVDGATLTLTPPLTIEEDALLSFGPALRDALDER